MTITKRKFACAGTLAAGVVLTLCIEAQKTRFPDPVYPFGAVYFRKSNPPEQDWARDHKTAAQMGVNIFRHWFMWASIENSPGKYDWRDYDRMVELEAQNHIKVVIAEIITGAPEWMWDKYPHARQIDSDGAEGYPSVGGSSATGSAPLCLDNEDVRCRPESSSPRWSSAIATVPPSGLRRVERRRRAGVLLSSHPGQVPRVAESQVRHYRGARRAWHRYSLGDWESVHPPHGTGGYPDSLDWLAFRRDNAIRLLHWRTELIRRLDKRNKITAHGTGILTEIEWRTAADVDTYGYTWVASRHGNDPWMQFQAVDLVRGGSRGKPFWHAEATGGPLWMQPQVINRPLEDGRSSDDKDVRVWSLIDMAAGATGILFTRWRPLLDGPLFGAFGPMGMDGSVTPQAEMAGKLARWTNAHPDIWKSHPVKGDVGIVFVQEADDFNSVQSGRRGDGGGGGRAGRGGGGAAIGGRRLRPIPTGRLPGFLRLQYPGRFREHR